MLFKNFFMGRQGINIGQVKNALAQVIVKETGKDVISSGLVSAINVKDTAAGALVSFVITVGSGEGGKLSYLQHECELAVKKISGVASVTAVLTAEAAAPSAPDIQQTSAKKPANWNAEPVAGVRKIIAIASGKGGVGKSTTTANLSIALAEMGKTVGVLDADIYGPSIPRLFGLSGKPEIVDGKMQPLIAHGVKTISMGYIAGEQAAILRGPMISKTLYQLLRFTNWGTEEKPLDVLLVDMPPGTGDIHLSMVQQVPLSGAIIVTTPQEISVIDARKCTIMLQKTNVKILGVVENMSYFTDANGEKVSIFGEGGGKKLAEEFGVPLLTSIPIDVSIRYCADSGIKYIGTCSDMYKDLVNRL